MKDIYRDPNHAASFSGINDLQLVAKSKVLREKIQKWLSGIDSFMVNKPKWEKFQTNLLILNFIDYQLRTNLVDFGSLKKFNQGYHYLLTIISSLFKFVRAVSLKSKTGVETGKAFKFFFTSRKPKQLLQNSAGRQYRKILF